MELSFVIKALQRRWWIIVLFSLLGAIPGALVDTGDTVEFQSDAVLLIQPPTTSQTISVSGDPDRYVQGQLNVLESLALAEAVSQSLGDPNSANVRNNSEFNQISDTDIVIVSATGDTPIRAQLVTQAIIDTYIAIQRDNARALQAPDIEAFNQRLDQIQSELDAANASIQAALQPYVVIGGGAVPDINAIAPGSGALRELKIDELARVQSLLNDFELTATLRVNTEVVQNASLPSIPVQESTSVLVIGGYIMGAMLGIVIALVWAQFSPYLIDEMSTTDVTGQAVVGTLTRSRVMRTNPLLASQQARGRTPATLAQLAVQAEALGSVSRPLVVVCIGPRLGAGATSTALAVAGRFAQQGSLVTVLDAVDRDRSLSRLHGSDVIGGLAELVDCVDNDETCDADDVLCPTELAGVNVIAQGEELSALRRANVEAIVDTAAQFGDVLIIDGGPLLGSAAVIEACRHADAIIVAVPLQRQLRSQLNDVVQQLGADRSKILTVVNEPDSSNFFQNLFSSD